MFNVELISERIARENLEKRRKREVERQERIFNDKVRTIGVDKEALDKQVEEKKRADEVSKMEEKAYDADVLQYNKVACIHQNRQNEDNHEMEKRTVTYRLQRQQPWNQTEFDLNDPDGIKKLDPSGAQMMLPGLVGEDLNCKSRLKRQKEQLAEWLIQQQMEQEEKRHQQKMEEEQYNQSRREKNNIDLEHQKFEMEKRKAAAIAIKEYNLAMIERKKHLNKEPAEKDNDFQQRALKMVPGLCPSQDRRAPPESLQQIIQFQKHQVEEKKRTELERKQEDKFYDHIRFDLAHSALLTEMQKAKLNKEQRRNQDSINAELAQMHKQQRPDIERGCIEDSFFSKFNNCSR